MISKRLLLSALLALTLILPFLGGCSTETLGNHHKASEGVLDLTQWRAGEEIIRLDGQWEFYWNQLREPRELNGTGPEKRGYVDLPGSWNGYVIDEKKLTGNGYATYRLTFKTEENGRLGIKIPRIFTSYNLWVNEELIASAGTVNRSKEEMIPQYLPQVAFFEAQQGENEIVIQVANFYHRSGGILESLLLGSEKQILDLRYKSIAYELFLFGCLIIIGAYHLALFLFRKKDRSPLYFGLFSMMVGVRTLLVGERFFIYLFPYFNWEMAHKLQTLVFYLGVPLIVMFFKSILPDGISPKIVRTVQVVGLVFGGLVLLTPAQIYSLFNPAYQLFALVVIIFVIYTLVGAIKNMETGTTFIVVGALALIITTLNDIVFLSIWMSDNNLTFLRTFIKSGNLSSLGQIIFVFIYSLALALKFSNAFEKEEVLTRELRETNANLDKLVKQRTKALEKSREKIESQKAQLEESNRVLQLLSLQDPLTGLWNRRQFDETMQIEWRRGLRHHRPVSLIILDIDYFKAYNDFYGHQAGDECLVQVARAINYSFNRASDRVARYGGEEFVVILPEFEKNAAVKMAHSLRKTIEELKIPHDCSPVSNYVTVSVGVATIIPDNSLSPQYLFLTADKALYRAKTAGRNQVKFLPESNNA